MQIQNSPRVSMLKNTRNINFKGEAEIKAVREFVNDFNNKSPKETGDIIQNIINNILGIYEKSGHLIEDTSSTIKDKKYDEKLYLLKKANEVSCLSKGKIEEKDIITLKDAETKKTLWLCASDLFNEFHFWG